MNEIFNAFQLIQMTISIDSESILLDTCTAMQIGKYLKKEHVHFLGDSSLTKLCSLRYGF